MREEPGCLVIVNNAGFASSWVSRLYPLLFGEFTSMAANYNVATSSDILRTFLTKAELFKVFATNTTLTMLTHLTYLSAFCFNLEDVLSSLFRSL